MQHQHWIDQAREHWQEYLPTKFEALQKAGTLDAELLKAAQETSAEMSTLIGQGLHASEAFE
jgi:mannitol/fructose-specific phosphotransferase system IIA component (Ntr-type)